MRRSRIIVLVMLIIALAALPALAKLPGEFTLGVKGGYSYTWAELELEYRETPGAIGVSVGFTNQVVEPAIFIRYYVPLTSGLSFYGTVVPSAVINFITPTAVFALKGGPGLEYKMGSITIGAELGYAYAFTVGGSFYAKGGIGFTF
jgi:hypothetical protein